MRSRTQPGVWLRELASSVLYAAAVAVETQMCCGTRLCVFRVC